MLLSLDLVYGGSVVVHTVHAHSCPVICNYYITCEQPCGLPYLTAAAAAAAAAAVL
jgi:hypothetical protein